MVRLGVGEYLEGSPKNYAEGVKFSVSDGGGELIVFFQRPTAREIEQFKTGKIKFGYYTYKNIIMLLVKIGELEWMDAPYSVHLSKNLTKLHNIEDGQGLGTVIMLVDALGGEVKTLKLVGAPTRLTRGLFDAIEKQKEMPFDDYDKNMNYLFRTYSTKELVKRANIIETLGINK